MRDFKKYLKNIIIFITLYFSILILLNIAPMIAAYGLNNIPLTLNTILMVGSLNIYTFITYSIVSGFSAGVANYILKDVKTSIIASIIVTIIIITCSIILDASFQFPLQAKLIIISIIIFQLYSVLIVADFHRV